MVTQQNRLTIEMIKYKQKIVLWNLKYKINYI
jgi:hypothetical protein